MTETTGAYGTECGACGTAIDTIEYGFIWEGGAACDNECLEAQA